MVDKSYFSSDTAELLSLLSKHKTRYLIVGGEAVIYYGHARLTGDIDLLYEVTPTNAGKLFGALMEFWKGNVPGIDLEEELLKKGMIFQFGVPPNRIDLISEIEGVVFSRAWNRRRIQKISLHRRKFTIFYIGLKDLIRNKQLAGRPQDLEDMKFLQRISRSRSRARR